MDPKQTVKDIAEAIKDGEPDQAFQLLEDLTVWINKGGFAPSVESIKALNDIEVTGSLTVIRHATWEVIPIMIKAAAEAAKAAENKHTHECHHECVARSEQAYFNSI